VEDATGCLQSIMFGGEGEGNTQEDGLSMRQCPRAVWQCLVLTGKKGKGRSQHEVGNGELKCAAWWHIEKAWGLWHRLYMPFSAMGHGSVAE